jgi:hypothetical protein
LSSIVTVGTTGRPGDGLLDAGPVDAGPVVALSATADADVEVSPGVAAGTVVTGTVISASWTAGAVVEGTMVGWSAGAGFCQTERDVDAPMGGKIVSRMA